MNMFHLISCDTLIYSRVLFLVALANELCVLTKPAKNTTGRKKTMVINLCQNKSHI